ncbi:MAG: hypothetical protein JXO72_13555 [Vicinamibacteria bacterium]|nr:hypothetical protein [Vicinamibacteria bacterium]
MKRRLLVAAAACACLAIYASLAISSLMRMSGTYDEVIHLPPGYMSLTLADHRLNPDHPPFLRRLAAWPLLFMNVHYRLDDVAWREHHPWEFGRRFLYRWNDAGALLLRGRLVVVGLGCLLGLSIFLWTRRHFGTTSGLCGLWLFAFSPSLLAHGSLVTNDLAVSLFLFGSVAAWERVFERVTWSRLALAALVSGCAFATKFSGAALVGLAGVPALRLALSNAPLPVAGFRLGSSAAVIVKTRFARILVVIALAVFAAIVSAAVIWASYGFNSPTAAEPAVNASFDRSLVVPENRVVAGGFRVAERLSLLPEAYLYGFQRFMAHTRTRPAFLMGRTSETGWWYYFPLTLLFKTPLPLLTLALAAVPLALRRPRSARAEWFLWWPPVIYLLISMSRSINIGHRHVLPVLPFLIVAAGRACGWTLSCRNRRARWVAVALLAWHAASTLRAHPHYLAYFNELAGGPEKGHRLLVDSNLDWGQDLPGLRDFLRARGIRRIKFSYFGTAEPDAYGIDAVFLPSYPRRPREIRDVRPGDYVAISATTLQGLYVPPEAQPLMERFRARRPLAVIGHTISVYRVNFSYSIP